MVYKGRLDKVDNVNNFFSSKLLLLIKLQNKVLSIYQNFPHKSYQIIPVSAIFICLLFVFPHSALKYPFLISPKVINLPIRCTAFFFWELLKEKYFASSFLLWSTFKGLCDTPHFYIMLIIIIIIVNFYIIIIIINKLLYCKYSRIPTYTIQFCSWSPVLNT